MDGSLSGRDLAMNSVGGPRVKNETITAADLGPGAVTASEIAANSVDSSKVAPNTLTTAELKGAAVNGSSISIAAGSVADDRCKHLNVTIGGAAVGEAVVFSLQSTPPDGMIFYGVHVSATNTVVLAVCNFTGGASPAISNLPVRVVTFG